MSAPASSHGPNRPAATASPVTAVVLGGGGGDALSRAAGVPAKALVPFHGRPLASYVLGAVQGSSRVGQVVYVGEATPEITSQADRVLPAKDTFLGSFSAGVEAALTLAPDSPVLVLSADLPWLTGVALDDFVSTAEASGAALTYPIIRREVALAQFPGQARTFVKLKDGHFTGGNVMLLAAEAVPVLLPFIERAYQGRKNPLALARLFGLDFIIRLALGRLEVAAVEARAAHILGVRVKALPTPHAGIGADVDKPEHLEAPAPVTI